MIEIEYKVYCLECTEEDENSEMIETSSTFQEGITKITFSCPSCGVEIQLVANETN